jgi:hypothetical protein
MVHKRSYRYSIYFKGKSAIIYEKTGIRDIFTSLVKLRNA